MNTARFARELGVILLLSVPMDLGGGMEAKECAPPKSFEESYASATAVFAGRVTSMGHPHGRPDALLALIAVEKSWKGPEGGEVEVWSLRGGEGFGFEVGAQYLVYANSLRGEDELWTSLCMRTRRLEDAAADVARLNEMQQQPRIP